MEKAVSCSRIRLVAVFLFLSALFTSRSQAQTKGVVNFGRLKNLEFVNQFYDGGTGSLGSGPGPNYGLQFTANAQAIISASKGGSGNFIGNPGGLPVMFFQTGNTATITAMNGVQTAIWFYYSALQTGSATIYSGPNGTGTILGSLTLPPNNSGCNTYKLCVWTAVGLPLSAPAGSITFADVPDYLAIGTMHIGIALPTTMVLASSQNPSVEGAPVTFTATVTAIGAAPAGSVTFKVANQVVGVVPVSAGVASITVSSLKKGSSNIAAKFEGTGFATVHKNLTQVVN